MSVRRLLALVSTVCLIVAVAAVPAAAAPKPGNPAPSYNGLALTPPMGWNDWSYYQCNINEGLILTQAKRLVSSGLAADGYNTVTIDDCWMASTRAADGSLQADPTKFPHGIAWLAAQVHALGLKFGIYEDEGTQTCGGYPGVWGHETQDADTFAAWGVDYVKLDGCNVPSIAGQSDATTYEQAYTTFSNALLATGRKIVFSDSMPAYFQGTPDWDDTIATATKISNLWREGADVVLGQGASKWSSIAYNYGYNVGLSQYAGPGHWNDPDFLITGDSGLTTTEMQSQMSLWAEMAAPLISSTDLTALSPAALGILGNKRIIAVDQDRLGVQGSVVASGGNWDVLAKPLAGGDVAVVLFNKSAAAQTIATTTNTVGLYGGAPYRLTDLVTGAQTATNGIIAADVAPHGTVMYRVHPYATGALVPAASLHLSAKAMKAGKPAPVSVTLTDDGPTAISRATVKLSVPTGWSVQPIQQTFGAIKAGGSATATFQVTSTKPGLGTTTNPLVATVSYRSKNGAGSVSGEYDVVTVVPYPNLAAAFNNVGVTSQSDPGPGNFDGDGNSFSAEQLAAAGVRPGATVTVGGASFSWPSAAAGTPDNVAGSGVTVKLAGQGSRLAFLGSEAGDVTDTVTVTYTDGTTTTGSVGFPNWSFSSPTEFGATLAVSTQGRNTPQGYADSQYAYRLFYNSIPIEAGKTVATVTLPNDPSIHLFALTVQPASTG
ncbi:MAG: alpha-galactosidase [Actinobacteria bacterium]|nr:alpha-galactosidase [Actinomycetota bacterium]